MARSLPEVQEKTNMKHGARNFKSVAFVLAVLSVMALASLNMLGQTISGNVVGTVIDASGAAVVGAEVEATNVETNVVTRTKTNGTGEYQINNLLPGTYRINVRAQGFKSFAQNADVQLNKTGTMNVTLTPGATTETVEVSGAPPIIDTTTAQLQSTYEPLEVNNVATASVGLGVINLSLLQAGVGSSGGLGAGTGPAVGGQRPRDNNFTIEGIDNNDKGVTGPIVYVSNDAVENFTVIQNQFSPEFGHSAGGQFNTSIKSGTNSYHGVAYEYFQNKNLNAIDNLVVLNTDPTLGLAPTNPRFDNNRFGGAIGGPIIKNKLFFFVNYEYNPIGQTALPAALEAPTAAGYSQLLAIPGISSANVQALQQWALAPGAASDQVAVCNSAPNADATCPGGTTLIDVGSIPIQAPNYNNFGALAWSVDWNISDRDQLRIRDVYNKNTLIDTAPSLPAFYEPWAFPYHLANITEFHTFTPSLSNEFRVGFHRSAQNFTIGNQTFLPTLDAFPNMTIDDLGGINVGPDPNGPQYANQNFYQFTDNLSWIKKNHTLKFGFEGRKHISPQKFIQRSRGDYEFTLSDFAWDLAPSQDGLFAERSFGNVGYSGDQYGIYWYVNDIWKIRSNLSLNFGLRYEYTSTPYGWTQQSLNSVADVPGLITFGSPRAPKNDWMPRVGFAYSPGTSGNTSIRGGFGMAYDVLYDNIGVLSRPPQIGSTLDCPNQCTTGGVGGGGGFLANGGIPPQALSGITTLTPAQARLSTASFLPNQVKYPYAESWNLGVSRVFHKDYTAEVRYVGSRGVHLNVQNRLNIIDVVDSSNYLPTFLTCDATCQGLQASSGNPRNLDNLVNSFNNLGFLDPAYLNAGFGTLNPTADCPDGACFPEIVGFMPWGASTYHGLQTQLDRRFSNGLYMQAAYTFSHTIDDSTADFFSTVIAPRRPADFRNLQAERANSVLDHRNRFTLSLVYDAQWFKHSSSWAAKNLLSGYSIAPTYIYETGQWGTVQSARDGNLNTDNAGDRVIINPAGIAGRGSDVTAITDQNDVVVGYLADDPTARYVRGGTGAIATGAANQAGRSLLASPNISNVDLTIAKSIKFKERYEFRFQLGALNLFNHPQYTTGYVNQANSLGQAGTPAKNVLTPSAANLTAKSIGLVDFPNGVFNQWRSAFSSNPRIIQLGAKFIF
jgi:hypothetical protein